MSKVLIDIPDNKLEWIRKKVYPNYIDNAIKNGIVLDGLTNGEALCMLFPNMHYTLSDKSPRVVTTIGVASSFDLDWWNAKWGE